MHAASEIETPQQTITHAASRTMHAVVHRQYGAPEVLACEEVPRPVPGDEDVLIRVHAAGVSVGDHHVVTGKPYLIRLSPFGGLPRPRNLVPGAAMAGTVEAVGARVTTWKPGDEVFGQATSGAFAEYLVMPAGQLARKPGNLSFEEAAAVPWGATALQGLRDAGGLVAGERVLINGASGGVGTWAVQIARAMGAEVTAVCSTRHIELMRTLGASEVIDYTRENFVAGGARFDVMLDLIGDDSLSNCIRVLRPGGRYVACAGGGGDWVGPLVRLLGLLVRSLFTRRKLKTFIMTPRAQDLVWLQQLVEAGKARPVLERRYPLEQIADALRHIGDGHAQGQTVVRIAHR